MGGQGKENYQSFLTRPKGEKIARAKNSGGAAGGGAALEQARPKAELIK